MEISIVMPCLNEAETVGAYVMNAKLALKKLVPSTGSGQAREVEGMNEKRTPFRPMIRGSI